ncbi:MAG: heme biosynthesis HemY N-terminal domain-containing protein [Motiliproteus sp.]
MKLLLIVALILLLAGTVVGELVLKDPGYVLLSYQNTTIETSIWGLVIVVLVAFVVFHLGLRLLQYLLERRRKISDWNENRTRVRANRRTLRGLLFLSTGDWHKAQQFLVSAADKAETPLINYLAAAKAAHEQGLPDAADRFLQQARKVMPKAEAAIGLTQAQIQLARGQLEPCLTTLKRLRGIAPRHTLVLKMLRDVYLQQQDWGALSALIPYLQKHDVFGTQQLKDLERQAYIGLMNQSLDSLPVETDDQSRLKTLNKTWKSLPRELSEDSSLAASYVQLLTDNGAPERAETFLRDTIKRNWDDALVKRYGQIAGTNPAKQLKVAESWLSTHPDNATLHLTLGRLSLLNSQWSKARDYFERSLSLEKSQETYGELARLLNHLDDSEGCQKLMTESFDSAAENLPKLPLPASSS